MRICTKCRLPKSELDFYAYRGVVPRLYGACKACHNRKVRDAQLANPDALRTYAKDYRKTSTSKAAKRRYRLENRLRYRANNAVGYALRRGKLTKAPACEQCGKPPPLQAHHADYRQLLEVTWLCPVCHAATRRAKRARRHKATLGAPGHTQDTELPR